MSKVIFSGIQPSGVLHIGNYLGALQQWVALQEGSTAYYCIVDQHAITVPYEPNELRERVLNIAAMFLACGLDPSKAVLFMQSHVPAHTELGWLLSTVAPYGDMTRMTQFKDKSAKQEENTTLGLFSYPVLMAADILLYKTQIIPVGEDQAQHVELTRSLAKRFNTRFGETFVLPEPMLNKSTARIMSLADPAKKMSKSDSEHTYIALTDTPDMIRDKIKRATTDTDPIFAYESAGPAVKNLLGIYSAFSGESFEELEKQFIGQGYKVFKESLAEMLVEKLTPLREKYEAIRSDESALKKILEEGKEKAAEVANKTLADVKQKMGLV